MTRYGVIEADLRSERCRWVVTGAGGFIGSHLVNRLLQLDQEVVGVDNFVTGKRANVDAMIDEAGAAASRYRFVEGDVSAPEICDDVCDGADYVLHQAALGSVPRSIEHPHATNEANITGTLSMLIAARDAKVRRFVYASSSATYGDAADSPKTEDRIGAPLSPYAVTKVVDELYASVFGRCYGLSCVGLRYFNVFGPRQDPEGAYAAVIPRWIDLMRRGEPCEIYGDGETSRDFCYIENAVQANILAARGDHGATSGAVYNVACGRRTTLMQLHALIRDRVLARTGAPRVPAPIFSGFRPGDIRHSLADIAKIRERLGYEVACSVEDGLELTVQWFLDLPDVE